MFVNGSATDSSEIEEVETTEGNESQTAETSDDVRSLVQAAYEEQQAASSASDDTTPAKSDRTRDERGRFAKAEGSNPSPETPGAQVSDQAQVAQSSEPTKTAITRPQSWSADKEALFASLPPEAQELILHRDRETQQIISRKSHEAEQAKRYEHTFAQYRDVFEAGRVDPLSGVTQLLEAQRHLAADFPNAVARMARANGYEITLTKLSNDGTTGQPVATSQNYDPRLYSEVQSLKQQLYTQAEREAIAEIQAFAGETGEDGQLKRPFFDEVHDEMMKHLEWLIARNPQASRREMLETAYTKAVRENDSTYQRLITMERDKAARDREAKEKVARATRAGASVRGAPGAGSLNLNVGDSIQDIVRAAFEGRI